MYTDLFVALASSAIVKELISSSSNHQPDIKELQKSWQWNIKKQLTKFGLKRSRYNRLELIIITLFYSGILDHSLSATNVHKPACNHFKFHSFNISLRMATIKCESLTFYIMQFQLVARFYSRVGNECFRYHDADIMKVYALLTWR